MNSFRFQIVEDRIGAARLAIGELHRSLLGDVSAVIPLQRSTEDLEEAIRMFRDAHLLFVKIENLLTIVEWKIEHLLAKQRFNGPQS